MELHMEFYVKGFFSPFNLLFILKYSQYIADGIHMSLKVTQCLQICPINFEFVLCVPL